MRFNEGVINLSNASVTSIGVGHPELLSPTGGVAKQDLALVAQRDLSQRLTRLQERLAVPSSLRSDERCQRALLEHTSRASVTRFSDGSAHLTLTLPLSALWCEPALASSPSTSASAPRRFALRFQLPQASHTLNSLPKLYAPPSSPNATLTPYPLSKLRYVMMSAGRDAPPNTRWAKALPHPKEAGAYLVSDEAGQPLTLTSSDELWVWLSPPSEPLKE